MGRALSMRPVATPSFIHLGNCPNLAQFVTGLIVESRGTNAAFATASAASGEPCHLRIRAPGGWRISVTANQPTQAPGEFPDRSTAFELILALLLLTQLYKLRIWLFHALPIAPLSCAAGWTREATVTDDISLKLPGWVLGGKGPVGQPWRPRRFPQQGDACHCRAARRRVRGVDAQAVEMAPAGRLAQLYPPTETGPSWASLSPA